MAALGKDGAIGSAGQQAEGLASDISGRYAKDGAVLDKPNPAALRDHLRKEGGAGNPIESSLRKKIAGPLGADPQSARVHTGPVAAAAAQQLQATAFTIGQDIFFGANKFDPTTAKGVGLIAHEATHVLQQTGGKGVDTRMFSPRGGDEMEQEAQDVAELALRNIGGGGITVQLYERHYQSENEQGVSPTDRQRLDHISILALDEAKRQARSRGLGSGTVEEISIELSLDLASLSDAEATSLWADAIMAQLHVTEQGPIKTHRAGAGGRGEETLVSHVPNQAPRTSVRIQRDPAPVAGTSSSLLFDGVRFTNEDAQLDEMLRGYMTEKSFKETESLVYRFDMASQGHKPTPGLPTATVKEIASKANAAFKRLRELSVTLVDAFSKELMSTVGGMLDKSTDQIRTEATKYGISIDGPRPIDLSGFGINIPGITTNEKAEDMVKSAKILLDVTKRRKEIHNLYSLGTSMPPPAPLEIDFEYNRVLAEHVPKHPILSYYLRNLEKLTELANQKDPREMLRKEMDEKLTNIAVVRGEMESKKDNLWLEPRLNSSTRKRLNMLPGTFENAVVNEQVKFIQEDRAFTENLKHAIGIGLTILAFVPGAQLLALAGGVVMGGVGVVSAYQDYMWEEAASGTSFDRALVISQSDPSLIGLAVNIAIGMGQGIVEAKAIEMAIGSFKVLAPILRQAVAMRRIAAVERTPKAVSLADSAVEDLRIRGNKEQPGLGERLGSEVNENRVLEHEGPLKPSGDPDAEPPTLRNPSNGPDSEPPTLRNPSQGPDTEPTTQRTPQTFPLPPVTAPPRWVPHDLPSIASKSGAGAEMVAIQARYKVKVAPSPKKGSSYFDGKSNTTFIDPLASRNEAALIYVHEMGHAKMYHERMTPGSRWHQMPRELYVNIMLHEEAMVQIRAIQTQRDLMLSQPGFKADTLFAADYSRVARAAFDEYLLANPGEYMAAKKVAYEAADQHIFGLYQSGDKVINSVTKESYQNYYGKAWDKAQPGAQPKAPSPEAPPGAPKVAEAGEIAPGTPELKGGGGGPTGPGNPPVRKGKIPDQQPANIYESIALEEARQGAGRQEMGKMGDEPRLIDNYGEGQWVKMHHSHKTPDGNTIVVHWFRNLANGMNVEFKFKEGMVLNASRWPE
jgi:hypothetical protein